MAAIKTNTLGHAHFAAAMADLDQTEICQLKTHIQQQNHQIEHSRQLADLDQTEIVQLQELLGRLDAENSTLTKEIQVLKDLKDMDQTQIVQLQTRVDYLNSVIARRDLRIQDLRAQGEDDEGWHVVQLLQEENQQLREKNSRLEEEIRQLRSQHGIEQQEAHAAANISGLNVNTQLVGQLAGSTLTSSPKTPLFPGASDEEDIGDTAKGGGFAASDSGIEDDAWDFVQVPRG